MAAGWNGRSPHTPTGGIGRGRRPLGGFLLLLLPHKSACRRRSEVCGGGGRIFVGACGVPEATTLPEVAIPPRVELAKSGAYPGRWTSGTLGDGADAAPSRMVAVHVALLGYFSRMFVRQINAEWHGRLAVVGLAVWRQKKAAGRPAGQSSGGKGRTKVTMHFRRIACQVHIYTCMTCNVLRSSSRSTFRYM